ncbi:MAG: Ig-like domain-containing protein, partial [Taibaiella sp.]|nr:Ig-like domain-containing protein [Taibaiella sp.]
GTVALSANSSNTTAWSWSGPSGFTSSLQNPTATPTATGTYSLTLSSTGSGCNPATVYTTTVTVNPIPSSTGATNNGSICVGGTVALSANSSNATAWSWNGPSGFTSSLQNPTASPTATATYSLTLSSTGSGCAPSTVYTTTVTVNPVPSSTGATNNGPICAGGTVTLSANSSNAAAWSWNGPSGFTSSLQNPTATPTATGTYSLTLSSTGSGCSPATVYTTIVTVNPVPSSTGATNNGSICVGGTVSLSANSSNATAWTWSGPSGFTSSLQNPTATPTATGTYSLTLSSTGSGCAPATVYTTVVTVNPVPSSTGATNNSPICVGGTVLLSANSSNTTSWLWTGPGSFSSTLQNPTITPTVTGTYSLRLASTGIGCNPSTVYTTIVTVNAVPSSTGATNNGPICIGNTVTLNANSTGATSWSWSGPDGYTSSLQNPTATPTATGTYSLTVSRTGAGCSPTTMYTTTVTVNTTPSAISGTTTVCVGASATLSNTGGGTWSSSSTGIATIGSATGIFTGVTPGTSTITYTLPGSCSTTEVVTINASPVVAAITGTMSVCAGSSTTLLNDTTGGTWSSSATGIAIVGTTGIVSAVSAGTARITYSKTNGFGCVTAVTAVFTVNPVPVIVALTGPSSMCVGSSNPFTTSATGGTWSSSATSVATVGSTGIVTGIASGTATISYTVVNSFGCTTFATTSLTVNPLSAVASVTGTMALCVGATTTLSSTTTGGVWSSSTPTIATVGTSGIVSGVASGTARITYSVTNSFGCTTQGTSVVTVNASPSVSPISGILSLCVGSTSTLSSTTTGGVWSSDMTSVATIGTSGEVTGMSNGTAAITYSVTNSFGCTNLVSTIVSVNSLAASDTITGNPVICAGATSALSNTTYAGVWSSSNTARATVGMSSGIVSGNSAGTVIISYNTGCGAPATQTVTVLAAPASINGTGFLCLGTNTTLTNATSGGTWTSSTPAVATISSAGLVTSVSQGTTTISYQSPSSGCYATRVVTVSSVPSVITGTPFACIGSTSTLLSTPSGGTWSSYFTSKATVNPATGEVTGISAGTTIITYALSAVCRNTIVFTVGALPATITGTNTVCSGSTVSLSSGTFYGTWTSSDTETATIGSTSGILSGTNPGTATITYTIPTGCMRTTTINVNAALSANTGSPEVCVGQNRMTLANPVTGGTWSSSNTSVATVHSSSALLSGVSSGTANITYRKTPGCYSISVATVNPAMSAITGTPSVCVGATVTLAHSEPGGTWSSSNLTKATADTSTGIITGINAGTTLISYILNAGCYKTQALVVYASPGTISGSATVCAGLTTSLSIGSSTGGTWSSSNISIATVGSTGLVTGVTAGTATISYQVGTGCVSTRIVTVTTAPAAISGTLSASVGNTTTLSSTTTGGTWISSNTSIATVSAAGLVTGINSGSATISYYFSVGCPSTAIVTISGTPAPVSGVLSLCAGSTTLLSSATSGGVWTSDDIAVADINASTGLVTGISTGITTISYQLGCAASIATVTVNPSISTITGSPLVCVGQTNATLTSPVYGGTWGSSNGSIANVHAASGLLTGISAGTAHITFTTSPGCFTTITATVNPSVASISGTTTICRGTSSALTNTTIGGTWSSSNISNVTIGLSTGIITGVNGGTATVSYIISTGCYRTTNVVINTLPNPISGASTVVDGASVTLTASPGAGTWSSADVSIASVNAASGSVTGVDVGVTTITYQLSTGCFVTRGITVVTARPELEGITVSESVFTLYPNPTSGILNINAPIGGVFNVYTLDGKVVAQYQVQASTTAVTLPLNLASGIYLARFIGLDGSTAIVRLVYEP